MKSRKRAEKQLPNGFTLLEVLLAVVILAVITSAVYASFASVTNSEEAARAALEEMRLRQFLADGLRSNLTMAHIDPAGQEEAFQFLGVDSDGPDGPQDGIRFVSAAPLIGGMALPGDLKEVRYEVEDPEDSEMELDWDDAPAEGEEDHARFVAAETPLLAGNVQAIEDETNAFVTPEDYETPNWGAPVQTVNFEYFDGSDWVNEWDSMETGTLPWAVRASINFAKTEEQLERERSNGYSIHDDPDFQTVVTIPRGLGLNEPLTSGLPAPGLGEDGEEGELDDEDQGGSGSGPMIGGDGDAPIQIPDQLRQRLEEMGIDVDALLRDPERVRQLLERYGQR